MKILNHFTFIFLGALLLLISCEKWQDSKADSDPRLQDRKYCNDPDAVNFNWGFPGVPDSTKCIFPTDLYAGTYSFTDSIYSSNNLLDTLQSKTTYTLYIIPLSKKQFIVKGFCSSNDSLFFTAGRTTYSASADSTFKFNDTIKVYGQPLCRIADTLSGTIVKNRYDTTNTQLFIDWKVISDTGTFYHRGTAIKQ